MGENRGLASSLGLHHASGVRSTLGTAAGRIDCLGEANHNPGALRRRLLIELLRVLPRAGMSRLVGRLAGLRLPGRLQLWEIELFARAVGIDLDEVGRPLESFSTLQQFFARPLSSGAREIDPGAGAVVAPCDGLWGEAGVIEDGRLCQVKGRTYSAASLLGDAAAAARFVGGTYATFYLAPHNYHRFHTPCALRIDRVDHVPGSLWPVNRAGLEGIAELFARNERLVAHATVTEPEATGKSICLVAVGAVMVGKIRLTFDDLTTNVAGAADSERSRRYQPGLPFERGAEWGWFEFGSTIVMLAEPGTVRLAIEPPGTPLRLGRAVGRLAE